MNSRQRSSGDLVDKLTGGSQGVIPHAGSIHRHHDPVDVAYIEVITHEQHRASRQLKHVLTCAVSEDRLEASEPPRAKREWVIHLQAGAGIVADSNPESEYQETVNKAAALGRAIDLAEEAFDV